MSDHDDDLRQMVEEIQQSKVAQQFWWERAGTFYTNVLAGIILPAAELRWLRVKERTVRLRELGKAMLSLTYSSWQFYQVIVANKSEDAHVYAKPIDASIIRLHQLLFGMDIVFSKVN